MRPNAVSARSRFGPAAGQVPFPPTADVEGDAARINLNLLEHRCRAASRIAGCRRCRRRRAAARYPTVDRKLDRQGRIELDVVGDLCRFDAKDLADLRSACPEGRWYRGQRLLPGEILVGNSRRQTLLLWA